MGGALGVEGAASPRKKRLGLVHVRGTWMDANGWGQGSGSGTPMMGSAVSGNAEAIASGLGRCDDDNQFNDRLVRPDG